MKHLKYILIIAQILLLSTLSGCWGRNSPSGAEDTGSDNRPGGGPGDRSAGGQGGGAGNRSSGQSGGQPGDGSGNRPLTPAEKAAKQRAEEVATGVADVAKLVENMQDQSEPMRNLDAMISASYLTLGKGIDKNPEGTSQYAELARSCKKIADFIQANGSGIGASGRLPLDYFITRKIDEYMTFIHKNSDAVKKYREHIAESQLKFGEFKAEIEKIFERHDFVRLVNYRALNYRDWASSEAKIFFTKAGNKEIDFSSLSEALGLLETEPNKYGPDKNGADARTARAEFAGAEQLSLEVAQAVEAAAALEKQFSVPGGIKLQDAAKFTQADVDELTKDLGEFRAAQKAYIQWWKDNL